MTRLALAAFAVLLAVPPAYAQSPWGGRARLALSAGLQPDAKGFTQQSELVEYVEPAPVTAAVGEGGAPFFDIGVAFPLRGRVGASVSFATVNASGDAAVSAGIPHPFLFDARRPVSGTVRLERQEMALHGGLGVLLGSGPLDVLVSGGATWFRVRQDLITAIEFDETYPYDTAAFVSASLSEATRSRVGYHAAADILWRAAEVWGLGLLLRYSRAEVPLSAGEVEAAASTVGGLQVAAGLRLIFP